jgi:hypothetical protein
MHILLYFSTLTESWIKEWVNIVDRCNGRVGAQLSVVFCSQDQEEAYLHGGGDASHVFSGPWKVPEGSNEVSRTCLKRLTNKYDPLSLSRLRMMAFPEQQRAGYGFEKCLISYESYFERLLTEKRIDQVLIMEPKSVKYDAVLATLELVAKICKVKFVQINGAGTWCNIGIQDDLFRTSSTVEKTFKEISSRGGLVDEQKQKVDEFFSAYERLMKSGFANELRFRHRSAGVLSMIFSILAGKRNIGALKDGLDRGPQVPFDSWEAGEFPYAVFLLDKPNNSRSQYLSPFFQNTASVIEQIAVSLPVTHRLVIRGHPHTLARRQTEGFCDVLRRYSNCVFVDPREDLTDLMDKSAMVFVVGSSSGVEALTRKKHVIFFGSQTYVIGRCEGVVTKISSLENLPDAINKCIEQPPPIENIYSFFFSLLSHTYRWGAVSDQDWADLTTKDTSAKFVSIVDRYLEGEM